jgi:hypothetical protein
LGFGVAAFTRFASEGWWARQGCPTAKKSNTYRLMGHSEFPMFFHVCLSGKSRDLALRAGKTSNIRSTLAANASAVTSRRPAVRKLPRSRKGAGGHPQGAGQTQMISVSAELVSQIEDQALSAAGRALLHIINTGSDVYHLDEAARLLWKGYGRAASVMGRQLSFPTRSIVGVP